MARFTLLQTSFYINKTVPISFSPLKGEFAIAHVGLFSYVTRHENNDLTALEASNCLAVVTAIIRSAIAGICFNPGGDEDAI
jgi:hypothetical protein